MEEQQPDKDIQEHEAKQKQDAVAFEQGLKDNVDAINSFVTSLMKHELHLIKLKELRKGLRNLQKAIKANPKWGLHRAFDIRMQIKLITTTINALISIQHVFSAQQERKTEIGALQQLKDTLATDENRELKNKLRENHAKELNEEEKKEVAPTSDVAV